MGRITAQTAVITAPSDEKKWGGGVGENGYFLLLEVQSEENRPAGKLGQEILERLVSKASQKEEGEKNFSEVEERLRRNEKIKSAIFGRLTGETLFLAGKGEVEVFLRRGEKIGRILSGEKTVFGKVKPQDVLLFSSQTFSQTLGEEKKREILFLSRPEEAVEIAAPFLFQNPQAKGSVALFVFLKEGLEEKKKVWQEVFSKIQRKKERLGDFCRKKIGKLKEEYQFSRLNQKKKNLLTIIFFLALLLIFSLFFSLREKNQEKREKKLREALEIVSHQFEEAVNLVDLNPPRARVLFSESKMTLSPLLKEFPKNSAEYKKVKEWLEKIQGEEVAAYKIYKLTAVPLFFDLHLLKEGGEGKKMAGFGEKKVILDTKNKVVYALSTATKAAEIIAGPEQVKGAQTLTLHGETAYLLNEEGILSLDLASKTSQKVINFEESWGEIISLKAYGGNLYLLDRKNHTIWKYLRTDFGFSARMRYLNPDVRVDFTAAQNLEIDGSVWVLTSETLQKFTRGLRENFAFKDFADSLTNLTAFSINEKNREIYLLDKNFSRILVFTKEGEYLAQYQWEELKKAADIFASEPEKKIFVLIGSKIYALEIK